MTRSLHSIAFTLGLLTVAWVAAGYVPAHPLALALVLAIGAVYLLGALELRRFRQASAALAQQLATTQAPPPALGPWLASLPPSLCNVVRLRIDGDRVALPGPSLTPYLTGLLVLLGMLGTFLGMVVTLKGTGLALEHATDVEAIRASLAAPVQGLGLAFGTSVAGVAASAMLGLMSALARRDRQQVAQQLDACIGSTLHVFSRAHQQARHHEESLRLQRLQVEALPALVAQLQGLQDHLLAGQARFHDEARRAYTGLAESVDRSLKAGLIDSARQAGAAIEPAVQATMAGLARESATLRETLASAVQQQLDGMNARLDSSTRTMADRWQAALADQQRQHASTAQALAAGFEQQATALLRSVDQSQATLVRSVEHAQATVLHSVERSQATLLRSVAEAHATLDTTSAVREQARLAAFHDALAAMTNTLQRQALQDGQAQAERQQQICHTLEQTAQAITTQAEAHARSTLGQIAQLVQAASDAPRAAAQVIGELRQALSDSLVRDNAALDERNRLLGTLGGLLDAVNHASTEQRSAIDALVRSTTALLDREGERFAERMAAGSQTLQEVAAQVTGSAAEVASLGEGFGVAVQLFSRASEQLMAQLQRIEAALGHSMARSDEQLAYYVAQAREIIDLTLGSHKQVVDDLQQLARVGAAAPVALVDAA